MFEACRNQDELRSEFRKLCKKLHPDNGGDEQLFVKMKLLYNELLVKLANKDDKSQWAARKETEYTSEYADLIVQLQKLHGIVIEQCGRWLWLHGNTLVHKDIIKQFGFRWSKNKTAWYWAPDLSEKKQRGYCNMETIRAIFGSRVYNSEAQMAIEG